MLRAAALGGAALAVGAMTASGPGRELDLWAFRSGNRERGPGLTRVFAGVTELGSIWASVGAAGVLAAAGRRRAAARGLAAASATWLAGQALKRLSARPRPYDAGLRAIDLRIARPSGTSWPSSHPAVLSSFLAVASNELALSPLAGATLGALAAAVGASRVHLGVHFPSDVVSGLLLGNSVATAIDTERR